MRILHSLSVSLLILALAIPTLAQTRNVATIRTRFLHHPEDGIKRLVRALNEVDSNLYSLSYWERERRVEEILDTCDLEESAVGENQQIRETVCPVLEDIRNYVQEFAQRRKLFLIDMSNDRNNHAGVLFFRVYKDMTREFIDGYNRLNP